MKNVILIILSAFVFSACSMSNNVLIGDKSQTKEIEKKVEVEAVTSDDEMEDEFDDEFAEEEPEIFDPLSGYNRVMTSFNDFFFMNVLNPVSKGYAYVLPQDARIGVANFFDNLMFPMRFSNNLLQLKFENATEELGRFLVNSTFGLAGFMDPAKTELGWQQHDEDFGQTLGHYGVGGGFHVVLPLLGPSNLRDMFGLVSDGYLSPLSTTGSSDIGYKIPKNMIEGMAITSVEAVNEVSLRLGQYENLKKDALDLYPFLRDIYNQKRKKDIEE